jgi:hypothetical protein
MRGLTPVLKKICVRESIDIYAIFCFRDGGFARPEFRYHIAKSRKDTKRCMYATRAHIYCGCDDRQ